jgi:pimeloyl-ACP methyl ester carboxylesterase
VHVSPYSHREHDWSACAALASIALFATLLALPASGAALALEDCRLESGSGSVAARCGRLEVPENRAINGGKQVSLHIAVVPALRTEAELDALVVLSGGPGQAASDFYVAMAHAFARIRRDRDIVILDQRGTGRSNKLSCPLPDDADLTEVDPARIQGYTKECLASLSGDPRSYTTSVAVRDLEDVRAALGYEKIDLYGVSYGTRVAQHYLKRYPARVRAMVLDGVVPPQLALGPHIPIEAQRALDALFERCASSAPCNEVFPALRDRFAQLRQRLQQAPMEVALADPLTAAPLKVRFGSAELNGAVRLLSYNDEAASTLPLLIHEAQVLDRPQAFAAQYEIIKRDMQDQLAYGMHFSVVCSEDAPRWNGQEISKEALEATYIGPSFMAAMNAICAVWPRGPVDDDLAAPPRSDVPVLVLSGENDPVTPPAYGAEILPGLPNSLHVILSGQGHGQLAVGCMPWIVARFIASASVDGLGEECTKTVAATPFMTSSTGPAP